MRSVGTFTRAGASCQEWLNTIPSGGVGSLALGSAPQNLASYPFDVGILETVINTANDNAETATWRADHGSRGGKGRRRAPDARWWLAEDGERDLPGVHERHRKGCGVVMSDLGTWLIEHGTSVVLLLGALRTMVQARAAQAQAQAARDEAAARATTIVTEALADCEKRSTALEARMGEAEARAVKADARAAKAEEMSRALERELKDLMRAVHATAGKD